MTSCPPRAKLAEQFLFQTKSTVIGGNSDAHMFSIQFDCY